jgi:tRNA-2-methylthio-N6-dimethylallyladenosine synthase
MRRRYTRADYLALVDRLRTAIPGIALSTDVIVGFPGESNADLEQTLDLLSAVRFHSIFSFKYSPRPGTLAMKRMPDDVPEAEKTRRILAVQHLQREIQFELHRQMIGSEFDVLVDGRSRRRPGEMSGRTTGNTIVNFPADVHLVGALVRVRVTAAAPNSVRGEMSHVVEPETCGVASSC